MPFVEQDGRSVAYEVKGDLNDLPVLLIGGTPGGRLVTPSRPGFYEDLGIVVVTTDRPGYGGSDPLPERRVIDLAGDYLAVMDDFGSERFAVLGGSGGGPHALAVAVTAPGRVLALTVQCGAVALTPAEAASLEGPGAAILAAVGDRDVLATTVEPLRNILLEQGPAALVESGTEQDRAVMAERGAAMAVMLKDALAPGVFGLVDDYRALWHHDWGFDPTDVTIPVHWYHGDDDRSVPYPAGKRYAAQLPTCEFTTWQGTGHLPSPAQSEALWRELATQAAAARVGRA